VPISTFYPGVTAYQNAVPINLKPGEERSGVSFSVQTSGVGSVKGRVQGFDAKTDWTYFYLHNAAVPDGAQSSALRQESTDGTFVFRNIPAGEYLVESTHLRRGPLSDSPRVTLRSTVRIVVRSGEPTDVTIQTRPELLVSGTVISAGLPAAGRQGVRVWLAEFEDESGCGTAPWQAQKLEGARFTVPAPGPGRFRVCATAPGLPGLGLAILGGQDVVDAALTVGESDITGVVITFGTCVSGLAGSVRDERGTPAREGWVIAFPVDRRLWTQPPVAGPRFAATRVSLDAAYQIASLVEGEYFVIAVPDDVMAAWPSRMLLETLAVRAGRVVVSRDRPLTLDLTIGR
jgi:hypothetical protein